jgi:hypothetical protein
MAVTPAEKQRRYRERLSEREQDPRDTIEAELLQEVERAERDELTAEACAALANKLADMAPSLARAGARKAGAEGAPSGLESSGRSRPIVTPSCASSVKRAPWTFLGKPVAVAAARPAAAVASDTAAASALPCPLSFHPCPA